MRRRTLLEDSGNINYQEVDLGGSVLWASQNIGASSETDYGLYFSWGETEGYVDAASKTNRGATGFTWGSYEHITGTSGQAIALTKYNSTDGKTVLDLEDDAASVNMGGKWRMPTIAEYQELSANTTNTWVTNYNGSGINGRLFTSISNQNIKLFFPAAGYCGNAAVNNAGSYGYYWSSSLYTSSRLDGRYLYFNSSDVSTGNVRRRYIGQSVRAVKDKPIEFSLSETSSTQQYLGGATSFRVLVNGATYTVDSKITVTSSAPSWATVSLSNGVITVTIAKKTTTGSRTATITVAVGDEDNKKTYKLTQQGLPSGAVASGTSAALLSVLFVNKSNTNEKYCFTKANWPSKTYWEPIGIVVIPGSHQRYGNSKTNGILALTCVDSGGTTQEITSTNDADDISISWSTNKTTVNGIPTVNWSTTQYCVLAQNSTATTLVYNNPGTYTQTPWPYTTTAGTTVQTSGATAISSTVVKYLDGKQYAQYISGETYPAGHGCNNYSTLGTSVGDWYLPSPGEVAYLPSRTHSINTMISQLNTAYGNKATRLSGKYLCSAQATSSYTYEFYCYESKSNGYYFSNSSKTSKINRARPFLKF